MKFVSYTDRNALMAGLAGQIVSELRAEILKEGHASLSVPGGTTPGPVFDILAETALDWDKVAVFLNDERWVDEDNPRSNTKLLRQRLLVNCAASAQLVPLYTQAATPETELAALSLGIAAHLPVSVLLLGMGADMHTASLFPGADLLKQALSPDAPILLPMRAKAAGEPRITLTAPVLAGAKHIHILITGAEKRASLEAAAGLSTEEAPVRVVLNQATIHWAE